MVAPSSPFWQHGRQRNTDYLHFYPHICMPFPCSPSILLPSSPGLPCAPRGIPASHPPPPPLSAPFAAVMARPSVHFVRGDITRVVTCDVISDVIFNVVCNVIYLHQGDQRILNELADLRGCSSCLYLETRKRQVITGAPLCLLNCGLSGVAFALICGAGRAPVVGLRGGPSCLDLGSRAGGRCGWGPLLHMTVSGSLHATASIHNNIIITAL